jgi:ClpP class serine protease
LQRAIHDDFIALVKSRRGDKLAGPESDLFSGEYWTGRRALELGLIDAIGDLRGVLRERFGEKVVTPLVSAERGFFGRRVLGVGGGDILGHMIGRDGPGRSVPAAVAAGFAEDLISALEARAMWARFGL